MGQSHNNKISPTMSTPLGVGICKVPPGLCLPAAQEKARPDLLGYWYRNGVTSMCFSWPVSSASSG